LDSVRTAGAGDVEAVTRLIAGFRDWWGYDSPADAEIASVVERLVDDPQTEYLLAGDPPAAVCQLRYRLSVWKGVEDCWLEDLYVDDGARGRGLGRALVDAAVERARARGCRRMELDVNEQNEDALRFYIAAGFTAEPKPPGRTLFISKTL
jgi:ribosomal protein S18 acetylase RimI-like enzyme